MKKMGTALSLVLGGLLAVGLVSSARAQQITQNQNFGSAGSPIPLAFTAPLTFNQFDPSLGTLNSVQVILNATVNASASVHNTLNQQQQYNLMQAGSAMTFVDPSNNVLASPNVQFTFVNSPTTIAANATQNFGPNAVTKSDNSTFTSASVPLTLFTQFEGIGTITLTVQAPSSFTYSGDNNITITPSGNGFGTGTVIYNFTPAQVGTPEPGTLAFLGAGVLGSMSVVLRRRNRKK